MDRFPMLRFSLTSNDILPSLEITLILIYKTNNVIQIDHWLRPFQRPMTIFTSSNDISGGS